MIRARIRTLLDQAMRDGARAGLRRAFKHSATPRALERRFEEIADAIVDAQWLAIDEWLDVRDGDEGE